MKVCIICQKDENSIKLWKKVRNDKIIDFIKTVKTKFGVAKNNELYVCTDDTETYKQRRKKFEKDSFIYGVVSAGIVIALGGLPLLAGQLNLFVIMVSIIIAIFFFSFTVLLKYVPAVEGDVDGTSRPAKKRK